MNQLNSCRICFEEDDINNMIYPCRCSGTSKFIHKECLNQWRTLCNNSDAFYKCFECNYKYNIINNENNEKTIFDKCIEFFSNYIMVFLFFNILIVTFIFNVIVYIDKNHNLVKIIFNNYSIKHLTDYYLLLSTIFYISVFLTCIIIKFSMSRNKILYLKYYFGNWTFFFLILVLFVTVVCCSLYFNSFYVLCMLTLCIQLFFKHHLKTEELIKKQNELEITNYDINDDLLFRSNNETVYLLSD